MRQPGPKALKTCLATFLVLGLSLSLFSLPAQDEQEFLKSDPTSNRTGLIFKNPELDSQGIPGGQFLKIQDIEPRAKISASYSNTSFLPPVNSQGSQGSCTAWAVGYYLKSYQENRENNRTNLSQRSDPDNICSPAFIYNLIHVKGDGGSYFSDAFQVLNDFGCPSLTDMPYDDDDYSTWPDKDDFENGIPRRTQLPGGEYYYLRLDSETALNQVKQLIQDGHALVFGINVYYNYDHVSSYGNIYAIADQSGSNRGGHAQLIVGYDDNKVTPDGSGAFRVVNSWGTGWGDSGFYWISYQAVSYGSPLAYGYAYWVDDRTSYSSQQKVEFQFSHTYSRETSSWIYVSGQRLDFFDFNVNSVDREYRSFPGSYIVLDVKDLQSYLTEGTDLRLYLADNKSNGATGSIPYFSYRDDSVPLQVMSTDTPVNVSDSSQGYSSLTLPAPDGPVIHVDKNQLDFASLAGGSNPTQQIFTVSNSGQGELNWNMSDNRSWITCSPSSGLNQGEVTVSLNTSGLSAGEYTGTITISAASAYNSPQEIVVSLQVFAPGADAAPFGHFDIPTEGGTVSGNIPVSGWALDDIEVSHVLIKRSVHGTDPPEVIGPDGLVYLGKTLFVSGARPDVEAAYPGLPYNRRAGWGCMILTNFLPNSGNGDFTLYAFAYDRTGHKTELGHKLIHCDNANRVKPFGSIDTPQLGEVVSGTQYTHFGWALTPPPKIIPTDGSTLWVFVDGVPLGHPVYNQYRPDIAALFPGYLNRNGAVGYYHLDTMQFSNGLHTLSLSMTDDQGAVDGVSRYFEIQNPGTARTADTAFPHRLKSDDQVPNMGLAVRLKEKGYRSLRPEAYLKDRLEITLEQLNRIVLEFSGKKGLQVIGWGAQKSESLPIGSTLDGGNRMFYWIPGPGFLGTHVLHFALSDGKRRGQAVEVIIHISPKGHDPIRPLIFYKNR